MEIKKILHNKRVIITIIVLCILQLFYFAYLTKKSESDMQNEEYNMGFDTETDEIYMEDTRDYYREYIDGYHEYIEDVLSRADKMIQISVFSKINSFSKANIEKTRSEYEKLLEVHPVYFENEYITEHMNYKELFGFVLVAGLFVVFLLRTEKQKGIKELLYATKNGRGTLAVKRILTIFLFSAIIVATYYGSNLILSQIIYGNNIFECLSYPVQSIEMFKDWTRTDTIGMFLIEYYIYHVAVLFTILLIVWTIFTIFNNDIIAIGTVLILGVVQYFLFRLKNDNTVSNLFKYCNLYGLACGNTFFTIYKNINIFNHAVDKNVLGIIFLGINLILFFSAGVLVAKYKKSGSSLSLRLPFVKVIEVFFEKTGGFLSRRLPELFKLLWSEKGILIILILSFVFIKMTDVTVPARSRHEDMYYSFIEEHEGVPDENSDREIKELREKIDEISQRYAQIVSDYEKGLASIDEYMDIQILAQMYMEDKVFLEKIEADTEYIKSLDKGWYINKYRYRRLFTHDSPTTNLVTFLAIVLLCSGILYYERKRGMVCTLRQCVNGRQKFFNKKIRMAILLAVFIGGLEILVEVITNIRVYGVVNLAAPVQSLQQLWFVKWNCSIGTFLICIYIMRILMISVIAVLVTSISMLASQMVTVIVSFVISIPTFLYMAGIEFMEKFSLVDVMSVSSYMIKHFNTGAVIAILVFLTVGAGASYTIAYRKWCK